MRALVEGRPLDDTAIAFIDGGYDLQSGEFLPRQQPLPIVWEQQRLAQDSMFVETNLIVAGLLDSHSNSQALTSTDAGEIAEEYTVNYMTKEGAGLKCATSMMLTAMDHIARHPSVAAHTGSVVRTGTHLATRTVNSLVGGHEWSLRLMAYALMGFVSFESSDTHWFIYPHELVAFVDKEPEASGDDNGNGHDNDHGDDNIGDVENMLNEIISEVERDDEDSAGRKTSGKRGGTRTYNIDGKLVFITQAESFKHRGIHFEAFSPLEFECIVDIRPPRKEPKAPSSSLPSLPPPSLIMMLLEGSTDAPKWCYEHMYVAYSRVPSVLRFRCFPLSQAFHRHLLSNLRPNIWATKWRMDIREDGYWRPKQSLLEKPRGRPKSSAKCEVNLHIQ